MDPDTRAYNAGRAPDDRETCIALAAAIDGALPEAENKVWHGHPVWFLDGNPIVEYSRLEDGVRLLFWSGRSFGTDGLTAEGTFKATAARFANVTQIEPDRLSRRLAESRTVQWDHKNVAKRRGLLERLKESRPRAIARPRRVPRASCHEDGPRALIGPWEAKRSTPVPDVAPQESMAQGHLDHEGRPCACSRPAFHTSNCIYMDLHTRGVDDVFTVLADPTRRRILDELQDGERSVGDLVATVAIHQPGVSRHLRILKDAGMVTVRRDAQRRLYSVRPQGLRPMDDWLHKYRDMWESRFDRLEAHLKSQEDRP